MNSAPFPMAYRDRDWAVVREPEYLSHSASNCPCDQGSFCLTSMGLHFLFKCTWVGLSFTVLIPRILSLEVLTSLTLMAIGVFLVIF